MLDRYMYKKKRYIGQRARLFKILERFLLIFHRFCLSRAYNLKNFVLNDKDFIETAQISFIGVLNEIMKKMGLPGKKILKP